MTYLLSGPDTSAKDKRIQEIKQKILRKKNALHFDYEDLAAGRLGTDDLKKAFVSLPVVAGKRLVLIRRCEKLSRQNQDLVLEVCGQSPEHLVLVLETASGDFRTGFFKKLKPLVQTASFGGKRLENVFDMTRAMERARPAEALKILSTLFDNGEHPLKIMGALMWFWGQNRRRLSNDNFQNGLKDLQEADLNIKRSRLRPEYAVEVLVVKLTERF